MTMTINLMRIHYGHHSKTHLTPHQHDRRLFTFPLPFGAAGGGVVAVTVVAEPDEEFDEVDDDLFVGCCCEWGMAIWPELGAKDHMLATWLNERGIFFVSL